MEKSISSSGTFYIYNKKKTTPIVFIHGVGLTHAIWQPQLDYFKDYTTLSYDILVCIDYEVDIKCTIEVRA